MEMTLLASRYRFHPALLTFLSLGLIANSTFGAFAQPTNSQPGVEGGSRQGEPPKADEPEAPAEASTTGAEDCDKLAGHPEDMALPADVRGVWNAVFKAGEALAPCETAVARFPDNPRVRTQFARALAATGKKQQAIEQLTAAAKLNHARAMISLASLVGDKKAAEKWLDQAAVVKGGEGLAALLETSLDKGRKKVAELAAGGDADAKALAGKLDSFQAVSTALQKCKPRRKSQETGKYAHMSHDTTWTQTLNISNRFLNIVWVQNQKSYNASKKMTFTGLSLKGEDHVLWKDLDPNADVTDTTVKFKCASGLCGRLMFSPLDKEAWLGIPKADLTIQVCDKAAGQLIADALTDIIKQSGGGTAP